MSDLKTEPPIVVSPSLQSQTAGEDSPIRSAEYLSSSDLSLRTPLLETGESLNGAEARSQTGSVEIEANWQSNAEPLSSSVVQSEDSLRTGMEMQQRETGDLGTDTGIDRTLGALSLGQELGRSAEERWEDEQRVCLEEEQALESKRGTSPTVEVEVDGAPEQGVQVSGEEAGVSRYSTCCSTTDARTDEHRTE